MPVLYTLIRRSNILVMVFNATFNNTSAISWQSVLLVEATGDLIIISLKINLFSPWYSWKIAELALSNNQSLTLISRSYILYIPVLHTLICQSVILLYASHLYSYMPVLYILIRRSNILVMVFNATFNNTSVISWQSVLLVEVTGGYQFIK